ncbi:CinA family protein [Pelagibacteraceae bacterium]|nr:CinA family protein [Pelagibacteraceae bacterium]
MPIIKKIINKLIKKNISISVAESCTGGLISNTITKYSGVSKIFSYGIISYSNNAKSKYLSVSKTNLSKFGAVSKEVAEDMINGLYKNEKTQICISTTGIAGPNGGTKLKPVGLVYIGIKINNKNYIFKKIYRGNRLDIQRKTRDFIFRKIYELI